MARGLTQEQLEERKMMLIDYLKTAVDNDKIIPAAPNHLYLMISKNGDDDRSSNCTYYVVSSTKEGLTRYDVFSEDKHVLYTHIKDLISNILSNEHVEDIISCFENGKPVREYDNWFICVDKDIEPFVIKTLKEKE